MVYNIIEVVTSAIKVVNCGEVSTGFSTQCGKLQCLLCGKVGGSYLIPLKTDFSDKKFSTIRCGKAVSGLSGKSLMGTFEHTIDAKGRMAFPNKLRERIGLSFIVTIGPEKCLYVYSEEEWENFTEKIKTLTGEKARAAKLFIVKACTVEPDKQGRILIPQNLREYAGLSHDVTVLGVINRAEIWDSARFNEVSGNVTEEMLMDALSDIAF